MQAGLRKGGNKKLRELGKQPLILAH